MDDRRLRHRGRFVRTQHLFCHDGSSGNKHDDRGVSGLKHDMFSSRERPRECTSVHPFPARIRSHSVPIACPNRPQTPVRHSLVLLRKPLLLRPVPPRGVTYALCLNGCAFFLSRDREGPRHWRHSGVPRAGGRGLGRRRNLRPLRSATGAGRVRPRPHPVPGADTRPGATDRGGGE